MQILLKLITLILPTVAMIQETTASFLVISFLVISFLQLRSWNTLSLYKNINEPLWLLIWCVITNYWSYYTVGNIKHIALLFSIYLLSNALICNKKKYHTQFEQTELFKYLLAGIVLAIITFLFEMNSHGIITIAVKNLFNPIPTPEGYKPTSHYFLPYMLIEGSSILSLLSWVGLSWLLQKRLYIAATLFITIILHVLYISDGLAEFMGFILGIITFIVMYISRLKILNLMIAGLVIYSVSMPIISYSIDPLKLSDKYYKLPLSAKHRLFIWNFTAKKIQQKPILGWGINSSERLGSNLTGLKHAITYEKIKFLLLPSYPHNNILQVLLELGLIGFILFLNMLIRYLIYVKQTALKNQNIVWGASCYSCFVNYFFISIVSFSIWDSWWTAIAVYILVFMHFNIKNTSTE